MPSSPNTFEVPADRPHLRIWPRRLPHSLAVPETSLWFNLEVSAERYPNKAAYVFFGRSISYAELRSQAEALAGWLQREGVGKGDRVALFMQNCPQFPIALYAALRADAVVVPVNPMNRADEFSHYITDPETTVIVCTADLVPIVAAAQAALPEAKRARRVLVTRFTDAMPEGAIGETDAPSPAMEAWLRTDVELPPGYVRWTDALAAKCLPGPHTAAADDLALLA